MNTNIHGETSGLKGVDGTFACLQSVHIDGRLDGLLLNLKARQHYRNAGTRNLEAVYTFPLPWGATLLGMNAEIDGHRLVGTVLEKAQASERYEKAIDEGDTPIMVERSARGLYTANLGNLKPGEDAVIEIVYAQLMRFEQGQIRITVPTTVGSRYGDAHATGGLAAHESVDSSVLVDYPLTVRIALAGRIASASVQSPSHNIAMRAATDTVTVVLEQGAFLDRDFVLLLQGLQSESFATLASDGEQVAMLASFCPDLQTVATQRLALKVLVDCSGSMAGDSMDATRRALHEILKELTPNDLISYSRFGSKVQHDLAGLRASDDATIRELAGLIYRTDANMGGTEMNAALMSTFKHGGGGDWKRLFTGAKPIEGETDVLLITDGDIWNVEDVIRTAQSSGHRIFAIGVGSAPAESLLREVAERTGGACELLSPTQDTAECIVRMFRRLRAERSTELQVDWGQEPIWQSKLPATLFGGDTVHVCARFATAPERAPVLSWRDRSQVEAPARRQTSAGEIDAGAGELMVRMVASMQLEQMARSHAESDASSSCNKDALLDLALRYQLVSEQTNLILVHARSDGEKATGLPGLKKIEHMPAAGWGGAGSVAACAPMVFRTTRSSTISYSRKAVDASMEFTDLLAISNPPNRKTLAFAHRASLIEGYEIPAFLRKKSECGARVGASTPREILKAFDAMSQINGAETSFADELDALGVPQALADMVDSLASNLGSRSLAWGVVLQWLADGLGHTMQLSRQGSRLVRHTINPLVSKALSSAIFELTETFGALEPDRWTEKTSSV